MGGNISHSEATAFQFSTNIGSGNFEDIINNLKASGSLNTTTSIKNVKGLDGLTVNYISSLNNKLETSNSVKLQYEKTIYDGYKLRTGANFSSNKATFEAQICNSDGLGFGLELNASLNPFEWMNAFNIVVTIPAFGAQLILKYNPITCALTTIMRFPFPPSNGSSSESSSSDDDCACSPIYITVDVINQTVWPSYHEYDSLHGESVFERVSKIGERMVEVVVATKYVLSASLFGRALPEQSYRLTARKLMRKVKNEQREAAIKLLSERSKAEIKIAEKVVADKPKIANRVLTREKEEVSRIRQRVPMRNESPEEEMPSYFRLRNKSRNKNYEDDELLLA